MTWKPFPEPAFALPLADEHTHTIILLHDAGTDGKVFGKEFLDATDLRKRLPTVRFVFPSSRKLRPPRIARPPFRQWFEDYSIHDPGCLMDIGTRTLEQSAERIREIVTQEAKLLGENGYERIILGGFGQGCVMGVLSLIGGFHGFEDKEFQEPMKVGAFFGLSGWFPLQDLLNAIWEGRSGELKIWRSYDRENSYRRGRSRSTRAARGGRGRGRRGRGGMGRLQHDDDGDVNIPSAFSEEFHDRLRSREDADVCMHSDSESNDLPTPRQFNFEYLSPFQSDRSKWSKRREAANFIRRQLGLSIMHDDDRETDDPARFLPHLQTPVFLGHGMDDDTVSVSLGEKLANSLREDFKVPVTWKTYQGLGHSYRPEDEIQDVLTFLKEHTTLPLGESAHQDIGSCTPTE